LRLERVEARLLSLPLRFAFETSFGRTSEKRFLLVSAFADGLAGHAECVADADPFYLPETIETVRHVLRDFLVPAAFALEIESPHDVLPAFARVRGHEMAKAALEMAVWELWRGGRGRRSSASSGAGRGGSRPGFRSACSGTRRRSSSAWPRRPPPATGG